MRLLPDLAKNGQDRAGYDRSGSGQNGRDPAKYDLTRPDPVKVSRRNLATATGRCRIPATFAKLLFLHFVIFSCEPNAEKYFRENHFFLKIISSKLFYDVNYFSSKQTEHKCNKLNETFLLNL
jgi:hypothetical protein